MFVRPATAHDRPLLTEMLLCAVNWDPSRPALSRQQVLAAPELAHYVEGWPRPGDLGVVAVSAGHGVGAAWLRRFPAADPGYGYVDERTPELSVGVRAGDRGRGIGTALCRAVLQRAREAGLEQVSLSVETANPATSLYERLGFTVVQRTPDGGSVTMALTLRPSASRHPLPH